MKHILLLGAGRSAAALIEYLALHARKEHWKVTVADLDVEQVSRKLSEMGLSHQEGLHAFGLDVSDEQARRQAVQQSDIVLSLLPPHMHAKVAHDCVLLGRPMVTASYISAEIQALDAEAKRKGVLLLNEMGLDPGIDHMSAAKLLAQVRADGHHVDTFESFTGGLLAPESNDNPWGYKFTWNPRNVVLAGQGGPACFKQEGQLKYIPYTQLFRRTAPFEVPDYGTFEGYANRDSLKYVKAYGLQDTDTVIRGTLRQQGYCKAWDALLQLGLTDDSYVLEHSEHMSYADFIHTFLPTQHGRPEDKLRLCLQLDDATLERLLWLDLFSKEKIGLSRATPAQVLQKRLEQKWALGPKDRDLIVMVHQLVLHRKEHRQTLKSYMTLEGTDTLQTAMAKTVGLPMGIAARLILAGEVSLKGVQIPIDRQLYEPVLQELETMGIGFKEEWSEIRALR